MNQLASVLDRDAFDVCQTSINRVRKARHLSVMECPGGYVEQIVARQR